MKQLEDTLELYLVKKAPRLPDNIRELIVKVAPWLTLIFLVLSLPAVLALLGIGTALLPLSFLGGMGSGVNYSLALVFLAITLVLEALAIPGLFKRSIAGWRLVYYATLLNGVYSLVNFNISGLIIGTLLGLYLLFQVKSYYK